MYNSANPVEALIRFWKNYFNFDGYATRAEYWWNVLLWAPLEYAIYFLIIMAFTPSIEMSFLGIFEKLGACIIPTIIFLVIMMIGFLSLTVRRIKDTGHNPIWAYLGVLLPYFSWFLTIISVSSMELDAIVVILLITRIITGIAFVCSLVTFVLCFFPSAGFHDKGISENSYMV